jgi:hypothetical protein
MKPKLVEFVVPGLDDGGRPSSKLLRATEVAVLDGQGRELGRFREAAELKRFLMRPSPRSKLVATQTVGPPRTDLAGLFFCDEQAWTDLPFVGN